jgi:hypothetical protein
VLRCWNSFIELKGEEPLKHDQQFDVKGKIYGRRPVV